MGEYKTARTLCEQLGQMFSSTRTGLGMAGVGIRTTALPTASEHRQSVQQVAAVAMNMPKALRNAGRCLSGHCWLDVPRVS